MIRTNVWCGDWGKLWCRRPACLGSRDGCTTTLQIRFCAVACCLLLASASQSLAAQPGEFRFHKDIERRDGKTESIVAVALDADVCAAARSGFSDLRVFDAEGKETPFLLEEAVETLTRTIRGECRSRVASLKERNDGIEVVVQLDDDAPPADGLAVFTPLLNYERRVRVFGGKGGNDWHLLVDNGLVFDYSRYMDVSNREIRLPKNDCRQLRVVVSGISDEKESPFLELTRRYRGGNESERTEKVVLERRPFRIDRIELWSEKDETLTQREKKVDYPVKMSRVEENPAEKTTIVYVDTRREPLTQLTLETTSRNFSRAVSVQTKATHGAHTQWTDIAHEQIALLDFGHFHRETMGASFSEQRQGEYRIVIQNEDSPPLKITGVKSRGNQYRAMFLAGANQTYRLYYGSDEAEPPKYDAVAVLAPLRLQGDRPSEGLLGVQSANAAVESPPLNARKLLGNPIFMGGVIAGLVVVFGWALFRAMRRINEIPKE
jgi:hypothetical protein